MPSTKMSAWAWVDVQSDLPAINLAVSDRALAGAMALTVDGVQSPVNMSKGESLLDSSIPEQSLD